MCPKCRRPRHSKCSGNKKNGLCELCSGKERSLPPAKGSDLTKPKGVQVSMRESFSQRRTSNTAKLTPLHRAPLGSSTPGVNDSSRNNSAHESSSPVSNKDESPRQVAGAQGPERGVKRDDCPQERKTLQCDKRTEETNRTAADKSSDGAPLESSHRLSLSSREVPPGEAALLGLSHVYIPVSTLDLFFRRFDMLQGQLDELKSLMSKGSDSHSVPPIVSNGGAVVDVANLTARVTALEGGHANHSGVLDETSTNTRLLLDLTEGLKDDLRKVHGELESVHSTCRALVPKLVHSLDSAPSATVDSLPSSIPDPGTLVDRTPQDETTGCREIVINGVLKNNYEISQESLFNIAFATLSTVYPSLGRGDIISARILQPQGPTRESSEVGEEGLGHRSITLPLCIARLASARLVGEVMRAKRGLANNYLSTTTIKHVLLDPDSAACMPNCKIFINEMLPSEKFQAFKSLRAIAQGLGFKYIWHAGGRFLARRKGGERAHVFVTAADLQAIRAACQPASKQHLPNRNANNNATERQEAAQANESARAP